MKDIQHQYPMVTIPQISPKLSIQLQMQLKY